MNKKLFLKLGLLLLSLSLIACGQKINASGEDNSSKSSINQFVSNIQSSVKESVKNISPSVENTVDSVKNAVESKQEDIQKDTQQDIQSDIETNTQQEATEKEYYDLIKEAWQKQKDYIDSIDDPKVKQSVQTTDSAAIAESTLLLIEHPEDSEAIEESLRKVLAGE